MSNALKPARPVPPGRILEQEIIARGWSQKDLAMVLDRPEQSVNELIASNELITLEIAERLAWAFGSSPEFWMHMESNFRRPMG